MTSDTEKKQNSNRFDKVCTVTNARKTSIYHFMIAEHQISLHSEMVLAGFNFFNLSFKHLPITDKVIGKLAVEVN